MKLSAFRVSLRFLAIVVICCAVQSISPTYTEGLHHEDKDAEKHPLPLREKRSNKNNATPNMPDILKRLQALEEK